MAGPFDPHPLSRDPDPELVFAFSILLAPILEPTFNIGTFLNGCDDVDLTCAIISFDPSAFLPRARFSLRR